MYKTIFTIISITILTTINFSCKKFKTWETTIENISNIEHSSATVHANFEVFKKGTNVGIFYTENENQILDGNTLPLHNQNLSETGDLDFELINLKSNTTYYVRGYIKKDKENLYSYDYVFTTTDLPDPPCEIENSKIVINGLGYDGGLLYETSASGYDYTLTANGGYGDIDFTFSSKPMTGLYSTVSSTSDLSKNNVQVEGVFGSSWLTCFYRAQSNNDIYVRELEDGTISIIFCEMKFFTSQSCTDEITISANFHD